MEPLSQCGENICGPMRQIKLFGLDTNCYVWRKKGTIHHADFEVWWWQHNIVGLQQGLVGLSQWKAEWMEQIYKQILNRNLEKCATELRQ